MTHHRCCPTCGQAVIGLGGVEVDLNANTVTVDGRGARVSPRRAEILFLLAEVTPRVVTRDYLMRRLYGGAPDAPSAKIIDVFICDIRRQIASAGLPLAIENVHSRGFRLVRTTPVHRPLATTRSKTNGEDAREARIH